MPNKDGGHETQGGVVAVRVERSFGPSLSLDCRENAQISSSTRRREHENHVLGHVRCSCKRGRRKERERAVIIRAKGSHSDKGMYSSHVVNVLGDRRVRRDRAESGWNFPVARCVNAAWLGAPPLNARTHLHAGRCDFHAYIDNVLLCWWMCKFVRWGCKIINVIDNTKDSAFLYQAPGSVHFPFAICPVHSPAQISIVRASNVSGPDRSSYLNSFIRVQL